MWFIWYFCRRFLWGGITTRKMGLHNDYMTTNKQWDRQMIILRTDCSDGNLYIGPFDQSCLNFEDQKPEVFILNVTSILLQHCCRWWNSAPHRCRVSSLHFHAIHFSCSVCFFAATSFWLSICLVPNKNLCSDGPLDLYIWLLSNWVISHRN